MNICGFIRANKDQTFTTGVFMDDFEYCRNMSNEYLADSFKTLSGMTENQGQIGLVKAQKNKIKAFKQWIKDQFRFGIDTKTITFPQADTEKIMRQAKTH